MRKQQQCGCRWRGKRKLQNSQTATRLEQKCGDGGGAADEGTSEISDIEKLLTVLPDDLSQRVQQRSDCNELIEVVLDLGRPPTARFPTGEISLRDSPLSREELNDALQKCGTFGSDNRAGMEGTLHRISCIRTRTGDIVGLTCRVGRSIAGSASLAQDEIADRHSILFLGKPGIGKTTSIREASRMLADDYGRRVVVVDTSNEIGGDGDVPHPGIGNARRMQVSERGKQHEVMIEAVENHFPEVIVIDEIGTTEEALAARTIAQRGVQLIATAHGHTLQNLIKNPSLVELVGGIQTVTLGDDTARARGVQKAVQERAAPPTFDCAIEMADIGCWRVYNDVGAAVDRMLAGRITLPQVRMTEAYKQTHSEAQQQRQRADVSPHTTSSAYDMHSNNAASASMNLSGSGSGSSAKSLWDSPERLSPAPPGGHSAPASPYRRASSQRVREEPVQVFPFQVSVDALNHVIETLGLEQYVEPTESIENAEAVLLVKAAINGGGGWIRLAAKERGLPLYSVAADTLPQIAKAVRAILTAKAEEEEEAKEREQKPELEVADRWFEVEENKSQTDADAMDEARSAAERIVISQGRTVDLQPRRDPVLQQQAEMIRRRYNLDAVPVRSSQHNTNWLRILPSSTSDTHQ